MATSKSQQAPQTHRATGISKPQRSALTATYLKFTQVIELDANATYYKTTITLQNTSGHDMDDVRFMRSFDPDQDIANYGSYHTLNDVLSNPSAGNDIAIAQAFGPLSKVSVNLVSF